MKREPKSFWIHLLYCAFASLVLLLIASAVMGPARAGEVLTVIGEAVGNALSAVVVCVIVLALFFLCILKL